MENIGTNETSSLIGFLGLQNCELVWFGNYLPFGVSGSNMDIVLICNNSNLVVVTIVELKLSPVRITQFPLYKQQVKNYGFFLRNAFANYGINTTINHAIVAGAPSNIINDAEVRFITYQIDSHGQVIFQNMNQQINTIY